MLAVAAFASSIAIRIADPLLPQIAADLSVTAGTASIVITAFTVAYGASQILYGPLGDRWGKYHLAAAICFLSALGMLACGVSRTLTELTIARAFAGVAVAATIPLCFAWIGDVIAYERRQVVLGRFISSQILGLILGQAAGAALGDWLGWRMVFMLLAVVFTLAGVVLTAELATSAATRASSLRRPAGFAETIRQIRTMLARSWVWVMLAIIAVEGGLMFGALSFVGNDLHARLGASYATVGAAMAAFGIGGLSYTLNVAWFVRTFGERGLAIGGGSVLALAWSGLALAPSITFAVPAIAALGLGFYMIHNTVQTNGTQMAPEARGTALALFATVFFAGQSTGVSLAATVVDTHGAVPVFAVVAVLFPVLGLVFAHALRWWRPG